MSLRRKYHLSLVLVAACGGEAAHDSTKLDAMSPETGVATDSGSSMDSMVSGPDAGMAEDSGPAAEGGWMWGDGSEPYPVVDASGTCGPGTFSRPSGCCAGHITCMGYCVILPGGDVGCDCDGVVGGCWPDGAPNDTMCCALVGGCTTPGTCFGGGQ